MNTTITSDLLQLPKMDLQTAQSLLTENRTQGLAALNKLFRSGMPPHPALNGRYQGQLIALDMALGLTELLGWMTKMYLPWLGKAFYQSQRSGENIFALDSYMLARIFNPFYDGFFPDGPQTYQGFAFHTYIAPGLVDRDRQVLKIDYNLKENPSLTIRRVLDELVQVDKDLYLGKAHVHWWWGHWQTIAYFTLARNTTFSNQE